MAPKYRNGSRCRSPHERDFSMPQIPVRKVAREPEALPVALGWVAAAGSVASAAAPGRFAALAQREHSPQLQLPFYSRARAFDPQRVKNAREQQWCLLRVGWLLMPVRSRTRRQTIGLPLAIARFQTSSKSQLAPKPRQTTRS